MIRVSTVQSPQPWTGTSATWKKIEQLNLDQTVNIITRIQQYDWFQSFPADNDRAALIATQRIHGTLELPTADNLTESLALQWTANKYQLHKYCTAVCKGQTPN